jgi:hypothetical protein
MSTELQEKKFKLEKQLKELEEQERKLKFSEEKNTALKAGLYTPIAVARIKADIWRKGERDFDGLGDDSYYTVDEILGEPDFSKDEKVVFIKIETYDTVWVKERASGDYYLIEEEESCLDDSSYVHKIAYI